MCEIEEKLANTILQHKFSMGKIQRKPERQSLADVVGLAGLSLNKRTPNARETREESCRSCQCHRAE